MTRESKWWTGEYYLKDLTITDYTTHHDIYALQERNDVDGKWWVINDADLYNADQWSIKEAIAHYVSEEGREERDESFRRAWGFYD